MTQVLTLEKYDMHMHKKNQQALKPRIIPTENKWRGSLGGSVG